MAYTMGTVAQQAFKAGTGPQIKVVAQEVKRKIKKLVQISPTLKVMLFGKSGSGKTYFLATLVEKGYKLLILDSDVAGDGLNTMRSYLRSKGKLDLMDNVRVLPIESYEDARKFIDDPEKYYNTFGPEGETWNDFDVDVICWDGFGNFQQVHIWEYALSFDGGKGAGEKRADGVALETSDWQTVLRATYFIINDFGQIKGPNGKAVDKIWSCHLDDREVDPEGKKIKQGDKAQAERLVGGSKPLLSGQGSKMVLSAADYVIKTFTRTVPGQVRGQYNTQFGWDCTPAEVINEGKVRGAMLKDGPVIMNVNPGDRWDEMLTNIGRTPK